LTAGEITYNVLTETSIKEEKKKEKAAAEADEE
jgi:hypothetical protein